MWGWGRGTSGYCGSASLQTVGLFYGNWLDQDHVRGVTGGHDGAHELMLADGGCCSSVQVARQLHLNVSAWPHATAPQPQARAFVEWMRKAVDAHEPVVFGVYMATEDGAQYDHIVPLTGYELAAPDGASPPEVSALLYNDLHANHALVGNLSSWIHDREGCKRSLPWSERFSYCLPATTAFGYRVHGNHDPKHELLPVRLTMDSWTQPDTSTEDDKHEKPVILSAEIEITHLTAGARFALLQYARAEDVPSHSFLRTGGWLTRTDFVPTMSTHHVQHVRFWSNSTQFFRCVSATATPEV